jgi:hypothetical protein
MRGPIDDGKLRLGGADQRVDGVANARRGAKRLKLGDHGVGDERTLRHGAKLGLSGFAGRREKDEDGDDEQHRNPLVRVNGEPVVLDDELGAEHLGDGDFHAWLRDAEPEEIVAIMARAMNCLVKRGLSDADVKRGLESLASQIDRIRNPQLVN